ncbi:hypothetical protein NUU61_008359 [Penicillium alfredii]|uniref:Inner centromere protein ARK-binding domain-containing protein n=1 Tax=Penicillium alfredii TaxID=1506179 RepID=A0A9W9ES77_9EURO|nr:uncharacterized protein NUU61_008359 [Penicillium alfredii]KAJ5087052.1 hypothetical protein NUU61_008359 [Penicillium alfredii]
MAASTREQKPVGSTAWIAAEKENMTELVDQEMEEVEYPVRHEMAWLNEHMAEIFTKGQTNFTEVFKTPGKMKGKTPRTARKRHLEENRVPLSEIFSSAHKQLENKASPSPFIHRVVSKPAAATTSAAPHSTHNTQKATTLHASQPEYPDLSYNLNSFPQYNTDSGYHGMPDDDDMVLPDVQQETQTSTQPLEDDDATAPNTQEADLSIAQQTNDDSFHSAQENVRARGETVEPMNTEPTPTQERPTRPAESTPKEPESEMSSTPTAKAQSKPKEDIAPEKQQEEPKPQKELEERENGPASRVHFSPQKPPAAQPSEASKSKDNDEQMEDAAQDDTVLDTLDDIGSPSDGSTPERPPVRKSSLSFASLPAREPLTKSMGGSRISRTSHVDLAKLNAGGSSHFGRQTGGHRTTQAPMDDNAGEAGAMDIDDEKEASQEEDPEKASKLHNKKSTQTLHERISMLGKLQPSRPKKSMPSGPGLSTGQVAYPDLPASKAESKPEPSSQKLRETPAPEPTTFAEDDWIKPLSSPQRPELAKSKTTDAVEKLFDVDKNPSIGKKDAPPSQGQPATESERPKSATSIFSSPRPTSHQKTGSVSNINPEASTTPGGSPRRLDGPLSASKMRLQSIMKSAKGLFTSTGSMRVETSSPEQPRIQSQKQPSAEIDEDDYHEPQPPPTPPRPEGRRTRSSTEKEEKRRQKEVEDRQQDEARSEKVREQEKQKALQLKAAQDKSSIEPEERTATTTQKSAQSQRQQSREPESSHETSSRFALPQPKQNDRRPVKPTREPMQRPKPQPVSIRVGSTLSRQIPMASNVSSGVQESNIAAPTPAPAPTPASKSSTLKKKGSNSSLHTASSTSSFKSSVSSQTQAQRKAQLASERKKEQEEREARRREEQKCEQERKRALQQQQEEARRQEMRSRAEAERERRERSAQEDPKKAAHMQAIEKRRLENARRHERQGSQQLANEGPPLQHEKPSMQSSQRNDLGASRPPSRLGSVQQYGRSINPPVPNPAKPPKRMMDEEASHRPAVSKPSNVKPSGEAKRRKTEDEHNPMQPMRPTMAPPIRQSNIRKEPGKPSLFGHGQSSMAHPSGSSIFNKSAQAQRPAHPMDMAKYASGKIPFAEPNHAPPPAHKPASSSQRTPATAPKPSPKYPSGENIHLPEIATDSEDEDESDSEMFPVPKWAQPKELESLLRQQDGMEVDSIFGPIAPFSLEDTFKADKKVKKFRDRTSSANWSGPDGLTQDEVRKDRQERQRLKVNGGWSFNP